MEYLRYSKTRIFLIVFFFIILENYFKEDWFLRKYKVSDTLIYSNYMHIVT